MELFAKNAKIISLRTKGTVTAIIAAGGSGTRLGGVSKPLIEICGKSVIEYSLEIFQSIESVTGIVISAKEADIPKYGEIIKRRNFDKIIGVVSGGDSRQESVTKAFEYAFDKNVTEFVAIHDAARPLITKKEVENAIITAKKYGTAVCAALCPDTVKRASKSEFVTESVERDGLFLIQTPQIFSYEIYCASVAAAKRGGFEATDDSSLAENAGFKIKLCQTSRNNLKITYPDDVAFAEAIIRSRLTR